MDKSIVVEEWTIRSQHRPILSEDELDALVVWLGKGEGGKDDAKNDSRNPASGSVVVNGTAMQLPEILFGNNALELFHEPSKFSLRFEARGALKQWVKLFAAGAFEVIKVQEAKTWQSRPGTLVKQQEYDWTWGTNYAGLCQTFDAPAGADADVCSQDGSILPPMRMLATASGTTLDWAACEPGGIDREMLRDQSSPILMYDEIILFEDFIHDHGVVRMSVKTRIMPRCWFVLLRYWLRVDGVVMKVFDTRCFHKFGEDSVYRERLQHFATFASLEGRGLSTDPSNYSDPDSALPFLEHLSGPLHDCAALITDPGASRRR